MHGHVYVKWFIDHLEYKIMNFIDKLDTTFLSIPMANALKICSYIIKFSDSFNKSLWKIVEIYSHIFM